MIPSFLTTRPGRHLLAGGVALLAFGALYSVTVTRAYNRGWNGALASVAAQNTLAAKAAEKVKNKVDECYDKNGEWNVETGHCDF